MRIAIIRLSTQHNGRKKSRNLLRLSVWICIEYFVILSKLNVYQKEIIFRIVLWSIRLGQEIIMVKMRVKSVRFT